MKKIQYNGSSKILNGIVTKVNLIIDKLVVDVKVNGTSVVVVNEEGEREADIDLSLADQNVKQSPTTSSDNSDYRVLLSKSANDTEETDISRKDTNLKYNPSTGNLQTTKLNGNTVPSGSGNDTLAKTSDIPDLSNYVQKSLTVGLIKNDGTIDQSNYVKSSDLATVATSGSYNDLSNKPTIPDELADLTDDSTHRLVSDTEKSTWNGKAELTDVDKAELNIWNLLRQPYFHGSGTTSGITRTVNADGSVTFTGTATASFYFNLKRYTQEWKLPKGTYRVSGCPSGGSSSTYFLRVAKYTTSSTTLVDEYGDGAEFTLTEESVMQISAAVINGYAIQGSLTFKPFIVPKEKVDEKVKQTSLTYLDDNNYRILLSKSASDSEETDGVNKYGDLLYNPAESKLTTSNVEFASANIHSITTVELLTAQYYFQDGHSQVVAMLEANSSSSSIHPTMLYLPSANGTLALQSELPTNPVLWSEYNVLGSKNLIPYPYPNGTPNITTNNVTISVDDDGVLTITGSNPSSNFGYGISPKTFPNIITLDPTQSYIMSGMVGGSGSTVRFLLDLWTASQNPETDSYTTRLYQATTETVIPTGYKYLQITLYFYASAGSLFPLTVKPMLRLASIADDTFEPYGNTNTFLSRDKLGRREQNYYGSKNLLPYPWYYQSQELNGVTFTDNGDGSVTANGRATADTLFYFIARNNARWRLEVPKGMYKLTGCPSGGSSTTYSLYFNAYRKGTSTAQSGLRDNGDGGYVNYGYDAWMGGYIDIKANTQCDNLVFRPMVRPFLSTDDTYAEYAQTNRQLTTSKADYRDIATVETTGKASKAYAKNELMIWRGDLHRVTQAITSGGSITLNTNVVATTLSAEIKAIRDALNI